MVDSKAMLLIILIFLVILHVAKAIRKYRAMKELEGKTRLTNQIQIIPDRDKGEDFEPFGLYDPIVKYLKNGMTLDAAIVIVGIVLIAITIYLDYSSV